MGHSSPAPHLVNGLRQLLTEVHSAPETTHSGLRGVVCGETELVGFYEDHVEYCGLDVADLVSEGSFESVAWLLMNRYPADPEQLADTCSILAESAVVDYPAAETMATIPLQTRPLDLFPLCISLLSCFDPTPSDSTLASSHSRFWRTLAQLPVLLHAAFGGQLVEGRAFGDSEDRALTFAGQLLQVLRQDEGPPSASEEHAMNAVMICECMTEMRPACFSARVFGSTVNDVAAGLKAASSMFVSQLRNDPFAWTAEKLRSFKSPDDAQSWWCGRESQTMPFGFQADQDFRGEMLTAQCNELLGSLQNIIMESSARRLESILAQNGLHPTTDWAAARTLTMLNVPGDRISIAIGIARMVGWAAQTIEQHVSGVQLLPSLRYAESNQSPSEKSA